MYETLAGWNTVTEKYDFSIASNITWINNGSALNISINSAANWSGPGTQTNVSDRLVDLGEPITAYDVNFSLCYLNGGKYGNIYTRIKNISIEDTKHLIINLHPNSNYSKRVKSWLTSDWPILNQRVWEDISFTFNGDYTRVTGDQFQNRWDNESSCPLKWRVISGPYYQSEVVKNRETGIYNPDW